MTNLRPSTCQLPLAILRRRHYRSTIRRCLGPIRSASQRCSEISRDVCSLSLLGTCKTLQPLPKAIGQVLMFSLLESPGQRDNYPLHLSVSQCYGHVFMVSTPVTFNPPPYIHPYTLDSDSRLNLQPPPRSTQLSSYQSYQTHQISSSMIRALCNSIPALASAMPARYPHPAPTKSYTSLAPQLCTWGQQARRVANQSHPSPSPTTAMRKVCFMPKTRDRCPNGVVQPRDPS